MTAAQGDTPPIVAPFPEQAIDPCPPWCVVNHSTDQNAGCMNLETLLADWR